MDEGGLLWRFGTCFSSTEEIGSLYTGLPYLRALLESCRFETRFRSFHFPL